MIAITDRSLCREPFLDRIRRIAEAGPEMMILREKDMPDADLLALAADVLDVCETHGVPLSVNSAVSVARELDICRVHLPMGMLRASDLSCFSLVGASVHSPEEAVEAEGLGADYVIAGHVYPTACKIGEPRGTGFLKAVVDSVDIPVYAVGGIRPENYGKVMGCGAAGACVMSSIMRTDDPAGLVRSLSGMPDE